MIPMTPVWHSPTCDGNHGIAFPPLAFCFTAHGSKISTSATIPAKWPISKWICVPRGRMIFPRVADSIMTRGYDVRKYLRYTHVAPLACAPDSCALKKAPSGASAKIALAQGVSRLAANDCTWVLVARCWVRDKKVGRRPKKVGRTRKPEEIRELILRMAKVMYALPREMPFRPMRKSSSCVWFVLAVPTRTSSRTTRRPRMRGCRLSEWSTEEGESGPNQMRQSSSPRCAVDSSSIQSSSS